MSDGQWRLCPGIDFLPSGEGTTSNKKNTGETRRRMRVAQSKLKNQGLCELVEMLVTTSHVPDDNGCPPTPGVWQSARLLSTRDTRCSLLTSTSSRTAEAVLESVYSLKAPMGERAKWWGGFQGKTGGCWDAGMLCTGPWLLQRYRGGRVRLSTAHAQAPFITSPSHIEAQVNIGRIDRLICMLGWCGGLHYLEQARDFS